MKKLLGVPIVPVAPPRTDQSPGLPFFEALKKFAAAKEFEAKQQAESSSPVEATKTASQQIQPTSILSQRVRSLEKEVKGRKKGKKRR